MKITKHEHALLELTLDHQTLIIDPGVYTAELPEFQNVVGITLSHVHDDHSYLPHIEKLLENHPNAKLFGPLEVAQKLAGFEVQTCFHGDVHQVGNFGIEFFGDLHQEIHRSIPLVQNLAVLVNRKLYYPGDAYTFPEYGFEVLACPSSAPWMKISDLIDYLEELKPKAAFPTHNALLSDHGHALQNGRIKQIVESHGGKFQYLTPGQSWS
jgi:L-ascorbate metabolism protein UlaG (beta-lactamase superfamily)